MKTNKKTKKKNCKNININIHSLFQFRIVFSAVLSVKTIRLEHIYNRFTWGSWQEMTKYVCQWRTIKYKVFYLVVEWKRVVFEMMVIENDLFHRNISLLALLEMPCNLFGFNTFAIPRNYLHAFLNAGLKEDQMQSATGRAQLLQEACLKTYVGWLLLI